MFHSFSKFAHVDRLLRLSFFIRNAAIDARARSAHPASRWRYVGVFRRVFVSFWAMSFKGINGSETSPSERVDLSGYDFQMDRINTISHATQMINLKGVWDGFIKHAHSHAMRVQHYAPNLYKGVGVRDVCCAAPQPTGTSVEPHVVADVDFGKEPRKEFAVYWNAGTIFGNHSSLLNRFDGLGATTFSESLCPSF